MADSNKNSSELGRNRGWQTNLGVEQILEMLDNDLKNQAGAVPFFWRGRPIEHGDVMQMPGDDASAAGTGSGSGSEEPLPCQPRCAYQQILTSASVLEPAAYYDDGGVLQVVDDAILITTSECSLEFDWWDRNRHSRIVVADGHECCLLHDSSHIGDAFTWTNIAGVWTIAVRDAIVIPELDEPRRLIAVTLEPTADPAYPEGFRFKPLAWQRDIEIELSQIIVGGLV